LKQSPIKCPDAKDCPDDSTCLDGYCMFYNYLCNEDESEKCLMVNENVYNLNNEMYTSKPKSYKPILKTCDKTQIDNKACTTDKCEKNEDCFSGLCYSNTCITGKTIYLCNSVIGLDSTIPTVKCKKQAGMKCDNDGECYYNWCNVGFCENLKSGSAEDLWNSTLIFVISAVVVVIILFAITFYVSKRHKKWKEGKKKLLIKLIKFIKKKFQ